MERKLTILLTTWNGQRYLPHFFDSLMKQTYTDWQLYVLDNGSEDGTPDMLREMADNFPAKIFVECLDTNTGFTGGYNHLFQSVDTEYVCILNQDMSLSESCLEMMMKVFIEKKADIVAPRLMKWNFSLVEYGDFDDVYSDYIDSLGISELSSGRVVENFAGVKWESVDRIFEDDIESVFGVSGAMFMAKTADLRVVAYGDGELFDESYFAYKEDIDLMKRLNLLKKKIGIALSAIAYHDRTAAPAGDISGASVIENKRLQSELVKYLSYRNHLKNLYKYGFFRLPILWYELKKFVWYLLNDRRVLSGWRDIHRERAELREKKKFIRSL